MNALKYSREFTIDEVSDILAKVVANDAGLEKVSGRIRWYYDELGTLERVEVSVSEADE
jgi:hypothetical protein